MAKALSLRGQTTLIQTLALPLITSVTLDNLLCAHLRLCFLLCEVRDTKKKYLPCRFL